MKKDSTAKTIEFLHAYGKCENDTMENAKPSPVEKGTAERWIRPIPV